MSLQLVIPASGLGSRFSVQGYTTPKPLLPVGSKTMIETVLENLSHPKLSKVIVIMNSQQAKSANIEQLLSKRSPKVTLLTIDYLTDGPASTSIIAKPFLDPSLPLVIANSDQYLATDFKKEYEYLASNEGVIWAMEDNDKKWSYVKVDGEMYATDLKEKEVISPYATCGVYGFAKASSFFNAYQEMVEHKDKVNNEYYVAPSYNYLIAKGERILVRNLGLTKDIMFGLGTPEDYEHFLTTPTMKSLN